MVPYRFYEFFAGAGLARLGLGSSWECAWANDIDRRKAAVYTANFGDDDFRLGDVAAVNPASLPTPVTMAWASFPCQDLSLAGWRRGMAAPRSGTFWAFWRIMRDLFDRDLRPPLVVLENVPGLLYGDHIPGLCEALASLGMQFGPLVIDARWFVPQSRPRVFIIAVDRRLCTEGFIEPLPKHVPWFTQPVYRAFAALSPNLRELWRWWHLPLPSDPASPVEDIIEDDPTGVDWHSPLETQRLLSMMTPTNLEKIKQATGSSQRSVAFLYKRTRAGVQRPEVRCDGLAGCLRTPEGGSSRQTVVVIENGVVRTRLLSPRESARLMGVPDSYLLPPHYNNAYRAMGDGVVVPVVAWLANHLLAPLAHEYYRNCTALADTFDDADHRRLAASREIAETLATRWEAIKT